MRSVGRFKPVSVERNLFRFLSVITLSNGFSLTDLQKLEGE